MKENNVFFDANILYEAGSRAMKGSRFKYATQLFEMNHLLYTAMLQKSLMDGTYHPEPGKKFLIRERGKARYISSNTMADKTINHVMSDEILMPAVERYLIHDNGASRIGKGVSFHRRRFEEHLRSYFREHGSNDGYILLTDFSGYYANIHHSKCMEMLRYFLNRKNLNHDERQLAIAQLELMFKTFRQDVSRFSEEEIQRFIDGKVDPMLNLGADPTELTGEKFLEKGVDIGNQNSQAIGIMYPYLLDNYAKIVMGVKGYGRYTDDLYAIASSRDFLEKLMAGFREIAKGLGLIINERKTRIVKLSSFYRHLQDGYSLTETGRVIRKINPKAVTRERRKLKVKCTP